jgi:hypothetical protein
MVDSTNSLLNQHQKIIDAWWADWYRQVREHAEQFHKAKELQRASLDQQLKEAK